MAARFFFWLSFNVLLILILFFLTIISRQDVLHLGVGALSLSSS